MRLNPFRKPKRERRLLSYYTDTVVCTQTANTNTDLYAPCRRCAKQLHVNTDSIHHLVAAFETHYLRSPECNMPVTWEPAWIPAPSPTSPPDVSYSPY